MTDGREPLFVAVLPPGRAFDGRCRFKKAGDADHGCLATADTVRR